MKIKIGSREIGDGCPPFIIAEVGSNWSTLDDCLKSISMAKACGADAVKFQLFDLETLYGPGVQTWTYSQNNLPNVKASSLPAEWLPSLKEKADACGIEFMCTAFSPEGYDLVDKYVNVHKAASAECTHKRILEKLRSIGKPVFLSTGAHGVEDLKQALSVLGDTSKNPGGVPGRYYPWASPVVLMYCVAAYPAQEVHLEMIQNLRVQFKCLSGYSDHTADVTIIPVEAVSRYQAVVLEKHFTAVPEINTPDRAHSLTPDQFKTMAKGYRRYSREVMWGPTPEEKPMVLRHNRRLIATRDIKSGDTLMENENFGIYRSLKDDTHAFSPFMIDKVNGRRAIRAVSAGDGIGPGDV